MVVREHLCHGLIMEESQQIPGWHGRLVWTDQYWRRRGGDERHTFGACLEVIDFSVCTSEIYSEDSCKDPSGDKGRRTLQGARKSMLFRRGQEQEKFYLLIYSAVNNCIPAMFLKLFWEWNQTQWTRKTVLMVSIVSIQIHNWWYKEAIQPKVKLNLL